MTFSINTYVGPQELFENQQELQQVFKSFEQTFKEPMRQLRSGAMKGLPDQRMVVRFGELLDLVGPDELDLLNVTLEKFFNSNEWKTHTESHRRPVRYLH